MTDRQEKREQFATRPNQRFAKRFLPLLAIALVVAVAAGWLLLAPGGGTGSHQAITAQPDINLRNGLVEANEPNHRRSLPIAS